MWVQPKPKPKLPRSLRSLLVGNFVGEISRHLKCSFAMKSLNKIIAYLYVGDVVMQLVALMLSIKVFP